MLPAVIRGRKRELGDNVSVTTSRGIRESGVLAGYDPEYDEVLISFRPSHDGEWFSLDPSLDDVEFA